MLIFLLIITSFSVLLQLYAIRKYTRLKNQGNITPSVVDYVVERNYDGTQVGDGEPPLDGYTLTLDSNCELAKKINKILILESIEHELCKKHNLRIETHFQVGNDIHVEVRGANCIKLFHDYLMTKGYIHTRVHNGYNGGAESIISLRSYTNITYRLEKKKNLESFLS